MSSTTKSANTTLIINESLFVLFDTDSGLHRLKQFARDTVSEPLSIVKICYNDEDGDVINVTCDDELQVAADLLEVSVKKVGFRQCSGRMQAFEKLFLIQPSHAIEYAARFGVIEANEIAGILFDLKTLSARKIALFLGKRLNLSLIHI